MGLMAADDSRQHSRLRSCEHAAAGNCPLLSGPVPWRRVDVLPSGKRVQVDHLSLGERMPFVRQSARGTTGGAHALADDRALAISRRPGDGARAARPAPVQELERVITRGRGVCQPCEGARQDPLEPSRAHILCSGRYWNVPVVLHQIRRPGRSPPGPAPGCVGPVPGRGGAAGRRRQQPPPGWPAAWARAQRVA